MKWKNKGHEFDEVYSKIEKRNKYYLYGAGDYGNLFYEMVKKMVQQSLYPLQGLS